MNEDKKKALSKKDFSKKGSIDKHILPLLLRINASDKFYTTSSCAGRILIYRRAEKKKDVEWIFSSHEKTGYEQIKKLELPAKFWFKQDSFILHIVSRDLESAEKLIKLAKNIGLKRSGIQSIKPRINIEILYHQNLEVPFFRTYDENYMRYIIDIANNNLEKNRKKIKEFKDSFSSSFL